MQKNKVRTAVVGAGKMGAIHAKVYDQLEQSDFIAIVDTDTDKARKLAEQYNCSMFSDYSDILGNVDAVTIATPTISPVESFMALYSCRCFRADHDCGTIDI